MDTELNNRFLYLENKPIETIYFGGGTPSLLTIREISILLNNIYRNFNIKKNVEITLEANPEDLSLAKIKKLADLGLNRLSIGVQSFLDSDLKLMNRSHNSKQAMEAVLNSKEFFKNISVDLIFGLPEQNIQKWENNYKKAFKLGIQHISAYSLTVEPNTQLKKQVQNGSIILNEEDSTKQFQSLMENCSKYGFKQYEISNYCKPGYESRHNISYWNQKWYLGIGPSAHSFNGTSRQWNINNNRIYIKNVKKNICCFEKEYLSPNKIYNEYVLTKIRTSKGINKNYLEKKFDRKTINYFEKEIEKWIQKRWVNHTINSYRLNKKGKLFTDLICQDLLLT